MIATHASIKTRRCLFALLLSITVTALAYGQGDKKPRTIDDYRPRTLSELSDLLPDRFNADFNEGAPRGQEVKLIVHAELYPSRVKVVHGEMKRPLLEEKKNVIFGWANRFAGAPEFYTAPYQTEMLFTEDGKNYWLAVRQELLARKWKKGEALELCVIKLGSARVGDKLEPVFLVERVIE